MTFGYNIFLLENNTEIVHNRFIGRTKEVKDVIKMMTMKCEFEVEFSKGMKKISECSVHLIDDWYYIYVIISAH